MLAAAKKDVAEKVWGQSLLQCVCRVWLKKQWRQADKVRVARDDLQQAVDHDDVNALAAMSLTCTT